MDQALEAGAEDVVEEDEVFQVLTAPEDFDAVREQLEQAGLAFVEAGVSMIPQNTVEVTEEKVAKALLRMMEMLEDHDDVQHVHANFDIDDQIMEALA